MSNYKYIIPAKTVERIKNQFRSDDIFDFINNELVNHYASEVDSISDKLLHMTGVAGRYDEELRDNIILEYIYYILLKMNAMVMAYSNAEEIVEKAQDTTTGMSELARLCRDSDCKEGYNNNLIFMAECVKNRHIDK